MPTVSRRTIWTLYFIVFVDIFQITFVFPILPKVVEDYGKGATEIGLLASVAAAAEAIASPFLGSLSDKHGRRPVLVLAMLGGMISAVTLGVSQSYVMVLVSRFIGGVCGGTGGVVMAYLAEVTSEEERPGYVTYFMASIFAGAAVGPAVAGVVNSYAGWRAACFAARGICAANLLCMLVALPPNPGAAASSASASPEPDQRQDAVSPPARCSSGCAKYFTLPFAAWLVAASNFFASIGFTAFEAIGVLYVQDMFFSDYKSPEDEATLFYSKTISGVGVTGLVTNIFLYSAIERRIGLKGSIAAGGVLKALGFAGIALSSLHVFSDATMKWCFFAAVQLLVFGDQIQETSIQMIITTVVSPSEFGKAMGVMNSCANMARALGPFTFGPVYEHGGKATPWYANIGTALLAAALPMLVRSRPAARECQVVEAGEAPAAPPDAPALIRQLSLSGQTTRSMYTNLPKLIRAFSHPEDQDETLGVRRQSSWAGRSAQADAALLSNMPRARSAAA
mmetsp:Transcript_5992/g.16096  ORF Transcript_5992/g.16096 Transcript_5992/m.16096 type:complete len:509 (-) Transcript_5992:179-1705(-)